MNFISYLPCLPSAKGLQLYINKIVAAGVNKTRKRRRCALFFFLIFFRFLLNKTENRKRNKWLRQTCKQKDSGTRPRWRIGVLLTIYTLGHRGCQYERFWLWPTVKRQLLAASCLWLLRLFSVSTLTRPVLEPAWRSCLYSNMILCQYHMQSYQVRKLWNSVTMSHGILITDYETIFNDWLVFLAYSHCKLQTTFKIGCRESPVCFCGFHNETVKHFFSWISTLFYPWN